MKMQETDSIDYYVFGSSRTLFHLDPMKIKSTTGKIGLNFGEIAAGPFETYLSVKNAISKNWVSQIFIQVDDKYFIEEPDKLGRLSWIPFLNENDVFNEFAMFGNDYYFYHYIPFYRYQRFDSKLGIRKVISNYTKSTSPMRSNGFQGLDKNTIKEIKSYNKKLSNRNRSYFYDKIEEFCALKGVVIHYFTSPYFDSKVSFEKFDGYFPNYFDFSSEIQDEGYFSDNFHLNYKGAQKFSELFAIHYFSNK